MNKAKRNWKVVTPGTAEKIKYIYQDVDFELWQSVTLKIEQYVDWTQTIFNNSKIHWSEHTKHLQEII